MQSCYRRGLCIKFILLVLFLPQISSCSWIKSLWDDNDDPLPFEYRDSVRWVMVDVEEPFCRPSINCSVRMQLESRWESGLTTIDYISRCCQNCERYTPACEIGKSVVKFTEANSIAAKYIKVPPHWPQPGLVIWSRSGGNNPSLGRNRCKEKYSSDDLRGANLSDLNDFLKMLIDRHGSEGGLNSGSNNPRDVCLHVTTSDPEVQYDEHGNEGLVAGRISCASGAAARARNCRYMITLWDKVFSKTASCAQRPFNTVAHEFKHILQSIELNLPTATCDQTHDRSYHEQEADTFASKIAPVCNECR